MSGSSPLIQVAVESDPDSYTSKNNEKCCKKDTFLFFPTFREVLMILFQNNCYTATAYIKIKEFQRYLKIIEDISRSSCRSSSVAPRSSWVAIDTGQNRTATGFNYLLSITYKKVAVVAVENVSPYKAQFSPFLMGISTIRKGLVAVYNLLLIVIYQALIIDKKCNCYGTKRGIKSLGFDRAALSSSGLLLPFNYQENRLFIVNSKTCYIGFKGLLVKGLGLPVLALDCRFSFRWLGTNLKKLNCRTNTYTDSTAHKYKKCGKSVFSLNKINVLSFKDLKKSVVRLGLSHDSVSVRGNETHPPIKNSRRLEGHPHLSPAINCKAFLRGFYKVIGQSSDFIGDFGFLKVGGRGEF